MQILIDGTFPFRAQTIKGYIIAINSAELLSRDLVLLFFCRDHRRYLAQAGMTTIFILAALGGIIFSFGLWRFRWQFH